MNYNLSRVEKRTQVRFDSQFEFSIGTHLADAIINKFLVAEEAVPAIDVWELKMKTALSTGLSMVEWSDSFYQLHLYCQKMRRYGVTGSFDPKYEFSEFIELWRANANAKVRVRSNIGVNTVETDSSLHSVPASTTETRDIISYLLSSHDQQLQKPIIKTIPTGVGKRELGSPSTGFIGEQRGNTQQEINTREIYSQYSFIDLVGTNNNHTHSSQLKFQKTTNQPFNENIDIHKNTNMNNRINTDTNNGGDNKNEDDAMLEQLMEIVENARNPNTLCFMLFDQLNLDPACEHNLDLLEDELLDDITRGVSKEHVVNRVRQFCRSNSGEGFYDPHNRMKFVTESWYEAMDKPVSGNVSPAVSPLNIFDRYGSTNFLDYFQKTLV